MQVPPPRAFGTQFFFIMRCEHDSWFSCGPAQLTMEKRNAMLSAISVRSARSLGRRSRRTRHQARFTTENAMDPVAQAIEYADLQIAGGLMDVESKKELMALIFEAIKASPEVTFSQASATLSKLMESCLSAPERASIAKMINKKVVVHVTPCAPQQLQASSTRSPPAAPAPNLQLADAAAAPAPTLQLAEAPAAPAPNLQLADAAIGAPAAAAPNLQLADAAIGAPAAPAPNLQLALQLADAPLGAPEAPAPNCQLANAAAPQAFAARANDGSRAKLQELLTPQRSLSWDDAQPR